MFNKRTLSSHSSILVHEIIIFRTKMLFLVIKKNESLVVLGLTSIFCKKQNTIAEFFATQEKRKKK